MWSANYLPFRILQVIRINIFEVEIKRRGLYGSKAHAANATLDEYALTAGCQAFMATKPGEKYQAPDGSWQTRGAGAPQRDARCP